MGAKGSSELNMVLQAKVVKLKVQLDIKGSKLPTQVNAITKALVNNPVKLKIKFDITKKALNAQMNGINTMLTGHSALKPILIKVEIDKNSSANLKAQLDKVNKTIKEFNTTYGQQVTKMESTQARASKAIKMTGGNVPTTAGVANFNNIKQYNRALEETRKILMSKLPAGQTGLFASTQMKDAQGNLRGFMATLTKANGVVEQVRYEWNAKKGQFQLLDRKTMTNTEAMIHRASQSLRDMQRDLSKTGQSSRELTKEFKQLEQAGKNGSLTNDMVKSFQTRVKNAIEEQRILKETNNLRREEAKILREIRNLTKGTNGAFKNESVALMNKTKNAKDLEALKDIRIETAKLQDKVKEYNKTQRESISVDKQKQTALNQLKKYMRETHEAEGALSRANLKATQQMAQRAKTTKQMTEVQKQLNSMYRQEQYNKDRDKRADALAKLEKVMISYGKVAGYTANTVEQKFRMSTEKTKKNLHSIQKEIDYYTKKIETANNRVAKSQLDLARNSVVKGVNSQKMRSLVDQGDITKIKEYIAQTQRLDIATAKISTNAKGISTITTTLASTGKTAKQVTYQIDQLTNKLRFMGSQEVFNRNANLGLFEQLRVAMARVPIWMGAMTAFYGSIRAVRSVVTQIFELDKALTEIKRVASDGINIDLMFKGSVALSKELGNNVHEILASVGELSRTFGKMNERQLLAITRTGTLMANVSDLNAEEAVQTLVGTMNAFNIEAEESIRIVDSLNEVDNNFAISTKQLSEGLSKSASTAKTFGVTMEESIGHITAIGSVTMESGRLIGNSLKTIYSRITTLGASEEILSSVGIAVKQIGENGEEVRPVNDILKDLATRWNTISASQQQNIAVTVAGRYQLSRFLALMNNYETALDATNTAVFSQGSAMRENAEYMKSYEARLNQLKNGWTELSDAIGNAFMKSAMNEVLRGLTALAEIAVKVADNFGVLPVIIGAVVAIMLKMGMFGALKARIALAMTGIGVAFVDASTKAGFLSRSFATLRNVGTLSMAGLTASARAMAGGLTAAFRSASLAVRGFTVAFQSMLASTIIGVAFVALGIAIEKLIKLYSEKKEKEKEMLQLNKKMIDSYRSHRDGMDVLVARHKELAETTNRSVEEEREYLGIQKQLAEQIPTTVSYIDSNGKAHLKTTQQINKEIEAVKELSIQEAKLSNAKFIENMEKKSEAYLDVVKNIKKLNKEQKQLIENDGKNAWSNGQAFVDNKMDALFSTNPYIDNKVHIEQNKVDILMAESEKTGAIQETIHAIQAQAVAYFEAGNKMSAIGDEQRAVIEQFISYNESMLRYADTPAKFEKAYRDLFEIGVEVGEVFVQAYDIMAKDVGDDPLALQQIQKDLGAISVAIPKTFYEMTDEFGKPLKSVEELTDGLKEIVNVSSRVAQGDSDWDGLIKKLEEAGLKTHEAEGFLAKLANEKSNAKLKAEALAQGIDGETASIEELNEAVMEAIDLTSKLFGVSGSELEGLKSHLQMMALLRDTMGEAGKETDAYKDSQLALTDFLGISTAELEKNEHKYYDIIEALGEVDLASYDLHNGTTWSSFIDAQEIDDEMKKVLKSWNGSKDILTGEQTDMIKKNEEVKKSVEEIKDVFYEGMEEPVITSDLKNLHTEADHAGTAMEKLKKRIGNTWKGWMDSLSKTEDDIEGWFVRTATKIGTGVAEWTKAMVDWFKSLPTRFSSQWQDWEDSLSSWYMGHVRVISDGLSKWGDAIANFFDDLPQKTILALGKWGVALEVWLQEQNEENKKFYGQWWDEFLQDLKDMPENIKAELGRWKQAFEDFLGKGSEIGAKISQWFEDNVPTWEEIKERINAKLDPIRDSIVNFWNSGEEHGNKIDEWFVDNVPTWEQVKEGISTKTKEIKDNIKNFWGAGEERGDAIDNWFKNSVPTWADIKESVSASFTGIVEGIKATFANMGSDLEGTGDEAGNEVGKEVVKGAVDGFKENEDDILTAISQFLWKLPVYIVSAGAILLFGLGREMVRFISSGMASNRNKKDFWDSAVGKLLTAIDDALSPSRDRFVAWGSDMAVNLSVGLLSKAKLWTDSWGKLKEIAKSQTIQLIADIASQASKLPAKMGNAISVAKDNIKSGITSMLRTFSSTMISGINAILKTVNKVLSYMSLSGFSLLTDPMASGGSSSSKGNTLLAYAKGTKDKKHQGGQALVGEEGQELAHIPNRGLTLVGQQGAEIVDLPKGSSVLPHKQTQQMLQSYNFPAYATGVGNYFDTLQGIGSKVTKRGAGYIGNILESGQDVFSSATSAIGNLFDKFSETPRKIIETLLKGVADRTSLGGFSGDLFGGTISTLKAKAIDFTAKKIKDTFGTGGNVTPHFGGSRMTSPFGWRTHPIFGDKRFHSGVDFANVLGTPINSQTGGKVTFSGASGNGFGNLVKIKNGAFEYFYAHLQNTLAKVGSMVKKGDLIGKMGSTGASTGSHLHYEVRQNGKAIAPKGFAIGGKVSKEQIIRVGEGDKEEMIIPLEQHKDRAVGLWKEAGERLGQFQYFAKGGTVSGSGSSYTVKKGDTLSQLAVTFKTTISALMGLNKNITNANKIYAGNLLKIPASNAKNTASKAKAKPKAFSIPLTADQQVSKWQSAIALTEQQMQKITEHSDIYRSKMKDIVSFEQNSLKYQRQILTTTEKRQTVVLKEIEKLSKVKRSEAQNEKYNSLRDEYASNIEKIQSLKVEIEGMTNTIQERTLAIFTNLVDGVMKVAEKRFSSFSKTIENLDFQIQVAEIVEPENYKKIEELNAKRAIQLKAQRQESNAIMKETQSSYNKAVKQYGVTSKQAERWKEELEAVTTQYQNITLEALRAEKAIKDSREEVADKSIAQLKTYYGKMKDMAVQAIDAEKESLQKAHDEKMKLYDKESEKITSLYNDKLSLMDKEKSEETYLSELNDKNAKKAELLNKISLLSRDTSLEGRKRVAELQKELADLNGEITTFQKDRQDQLLRDALEAQKQAQLDAIEAKKETSEAENKVALDSLDSQKETVSKQYEDLIDNERHWANIRDEYIKGSFTKLNAELKAMYASIDAMVKGNFGKVIGFNMLSEEAKKEFINSNSQDVDNTKLQNDALKKEVDSSQKANTDTTVKKGRLLTGWYMDKKRAEQVKKIIANEYGGTSTKVLADPKSGGWKVSGDFQSTIRAGEVKANMQARKLLSYADVTAFDTGGYTGDWGSSQGKLAVLHEKEIVLNKHQTKDFLNSMKLMDKITSVLPKMNRSSMSDKLATASGVNVSNNYDVNVHIENINGGNKKAGEEVANAVLKGLKKRGS